ncbi:hypothetical protein BDW69DRAFT_6500 [Aspergillus filifer]
MMHVLTNILSGPLMQHFAVRMRRFRATGPSFFLADPVRLLPKSSLQISASLALPACSRSYRRIRRRSAWCSGCLYGLLLCWLQCQRPSLPSTASDLRHPFDKYDPMSRLMGGASSLAPLPYYSLASDPSRLTSRVAIHS